MDHLSKFSMVQAISLVFTCFNPLGHECLLRGPGTLEPGLRAWEDPRLVGVNDSERCPEVDPTIVGHPLLHRPVRAGAAPKQIRQ